MPDDADDLELRIDEIEIEALADGVLISEILARKIFVDDADARRIPAVLRADEAAA